MSENIPSEELIIRFLNDAVSPEEIEIIHSWRKANPSNEREFQAIREFFSKTDYPQIVVIPEMSLPQNVHLRRSNSPKLIKNWGWTLAASITLLLGVIGIWAVNQSEPEVFTSGEIELPDSSIVQIAPGSELQKLGSRSYYLKGSCWFEVNKLPVGSPFTVHTAAASITVLGTRFLIHSDSASTQVTVLSGLVEVSSTKNPDSVSAILPSGGETTIRNDSTYSGNPTIQSQTYIQWSDSGVVLTKIPVFMLFREISLQYNVTIDVENDQISWQTISGVFEKSSPEFLVDQVCKLMGLVYSKTETGFLISTS